MTAAITIHFKKAHLTRNCIQSLLADGWNPILVWDNSADSGVSSQSLKSEFAHDSRVCWGSQDTNLGFGRGMNAALSTLASQGYHGPVLLINNDAQVMPGLRSALLGALQPNPTLALIAPRILQEEQEHGWLYYHPWLGLVTQRYLPGSFAYLSGCCLLVKTPNLTKPLFDEDFFMYGEDVELSWRVRKQHGQLTLLEQALVLHEGSASSGQSSAAYEQFLIQAHWILAKKLGRTTFSQRLMQAFRIPILVARAIVRAQRYRTLLPILSLFRGSDQKHVAGHK